MLKIMIRGLMLAGALFGSALALADPPYTEGNVVQVAGIRTEYGRFDDYMRFLGGPYKKEMEAAKKAGLIVDYQVLSVEPRGADDPDVYLVTTFKNYAALDGLSAKMDAIAAQVYGSVEQSDKSAVDRGKMRHTLGTTTMRVLNLK